MPKTEIKLFLNKLYLLSICLLIHPFQKIIFLILYFIVINLVLGGDPVYAVESNYSAGSCCSGPSAQSEPYSIDAAPCAPPPLPLPLDPVNQFRVENAQMEDDLFTRIRLLEDREIEGLPPQLERGEYENMIRDFLNDTITVDHYYRTVTHELFSIDMLVKKADIVEKLLDLLLSEPPARLHAILEQLPPFRERYIRMEALEFLDDDLLNFVDPHSYNLVDKTILSNTLHFCEQSLSQQGHSSIFYLRFLQHYCGF